MRTSNQIRSEARAILSELAMKHPILGCLPIRVSSRMTRTAGKAVWKGGVPLEIVLSLPFFADEANDLKVTTVHEAAHIVAGIAAGHGWTWKMVNRGMGGTATRCHSMSLAQGFTARRLQPRKLVEATCSKCGQGMTLGPTQARKASRGVRYTHGKCPR